MRRPLAHKPKWVAAGAVALVVVLSAGAWGVTRSDGGAATPTSRVVTIAAGAIERTVSSTGTIAPAQKAALNFAVAGEVTAVAAKVGQKVKKGQTLAKIDTDALSRAVTTAKANRDAAAEALDSVEASGASATQVSSAEAQLVTAEDRLAAAREDLAAGTLTSPFTGTVATVALDVGDRVGASGGSSPSGGSGAGGSSAAQVVVIATDAWVVDASVGSADLAQIKKGQQVRITPSGATQAVFGTVGSVGIVAASSSGGSATFPVQVKVTGDPDGLYAGGTAALTIVVKSLQDVLTVPTQALRTSGTDTVVIKVVNGKEVTTPVTVGTSYGPSTQIVSGLVAGDQVKLTDLRAGAAGAGAGRRTGGNGGANTGGFGGGFSGGTFPGGAIPAGGFVVGGATGGGAGFGGNR